MDNIEFKKLFIKHLYSRNVFTDRPSDVQYRTRCPFCGDSKTKQNTGHLYFKIDLNNNRSGIVYNCFKCPAKGLLRSDDLEMFGLNNHALRDILNDVNKNVKFIPSAINTHVINDTYYDFYISDIIDRRKLSYIENRLGIYISNDDVKNLKIVTSLREFLIFNEIKTITCKPKMAKYLESNFVGFLSKNNSHIIFRNIDEKADIRWIKYPILEESKLQRAYYSIPNNIDLFTDDIITINLSEGAMDILSIYYNFDNMGDNKINIAVCGKWYVSILKYIFNLGLIGDNIIINIYADNDGADDTSIKYYEEIFKNYKYLVKEVNIKYNTIGKDCGVPQDKIKLKSIRLK